MVEISNRLATRLALLLTLALAPLGFIAVYSEYQGWRAQRAAIEADLIARTISTVAGQRALLESAMLSIDLLSPLVVDRFGDPEACSSVLEEFIESSGFFSFAGFVDTDGRMDCMSEGEPVDFVAGDKFLAAIADPQSSFSFRPAVAMTGRPAVLASRPVFHDDALLGFLSISISRRSFDLISTQPDPDTAPNVAYLVNHQGHTLANFDEATASRMLPAEESLARFIMQRSGIFPDYSESGSLRVFAMAELFSDRLFALGSWDADQVPSAFEFNYVRKGFPLLMWLASVVVVMVAISYLVVRHLKDINGKLRRFALGDRTNLVRLPDNAPAELREIDSTFTKMAQIIRRDELEREEALREKTTLLREVHHRVKNNLQLIASILNLQMRRLSDPQAQSILKGVQDRFRSLASIHRTLYERSRLSGSHNATEFIESILHETLAIGQSDQYRLEIEKHLDPIALPPDKIIPTALLFTEALTNALKYVSAPRCGDAPRLRVSFLNNGGYAELRLWNSLGRPSGPGIATGLGQELMTAFASQIQGELVTGPTDNADGCGWQVRLRLSTAAWKSNDAPVGSVDQTSEQVGE